ncbi:MAG: hypothetical protein JKY42_01300 [Flavobacteriales bacterium]|nr:hypothetical protein [Flavobacteriales bacterium]
MLTGLLHAHSTLRWIVLVLMILAGIKSLIGWLNKSSYEPIDDKLSLFTLIATHTQLLIGFGLYFMSPRVDFSNIADGTTRYFTIEHAFLMILVAVLITIGRSKSKKKEEAVDKHKTVALFYLISLAIVVVTVFVMMP